MPRVVLSVTPCQPAFWHDNKSHCIFTPSAPGAIRRASSINICQGVSAVQNSFLTHSSTPDASHCIPGLYNPAWLSSSQVEPRTDLTAKYQPGRCGPLKFPMYRKRARVHFVRHQRQKGRTGYRDLRKSPVCQRVSRALLRRCSVAYQSVHPLPPDEGRVGVEYRGL